MKHPQIESLDPGRYSVRSTVGTFWIEKETDGTVHQLTPETLVRDGVLARDGWNRVLPFTIKRIEEKK
jgi:hypothetical protein